MTRQIPILASNQRGEGMGGIFAMIILFVMCVKLGLGIIPAQLEDRTLSSLMSLELKNANDNKKDAAKLFSEYNRQLITNGFRDFTAEDLFEVTGATVGSLQIQKNYVRESTLFPGVYITNKFEGQIEELAPE